MKSIIMPWALRHSLLVHFLLAFGIWLLIQRSPLPPVFFSLNADSRLQLIEPPSSRSSTSGNVAYSNGSAKRPTVPSGTTPQKSKPTAPLSSSAGTATEAHSELLRITAFILQRIEEKLEYPMTLRVRGIEGTPKIRLVMNQKGELISTDVVETSGYSELDELALDAVREAAPFPEFPQNWNQLETEKGRFITNLPIRFQISQRR